jgi:Fe-Mn family superoxide dismutase
MTHTLPALPYEYDALEPTISKDIMVLHHTKHHQTYVDKLNAALEGHPELQDKLVSELLIELHNLPKDLQPAVRNHGGGHYNHSIFWETMSPSGGGKPTGDVLKAIEDRYGSFEKFVEEFNAKALGLFGSGWVWVQRDMEIYTTQNQDTRISEGGPAPLFGLDVWEHAYYLDYKNKRDEYIKNWWNVVNWDYVAERYTGW